VRRSVGRHDHLYAVALAEAPDESFRASILAQEPYASLFSIHRSSVA
jgi:hypothetical protein